MINSLLKKVVMIDKKALGQRIKAIRLRLGLTMEEFIERIDNKPGRGRSGTVNNWETGKNAPNKNRLKRIAELGGVSVEYLLNGCPQLSLKEMKELRNRVIHDAATDIEKQQLREINLENSINFSSIKSHFTQGSNAMVKEEQQLFATNPLTPLDNVSLAYAMNIINEVRLRGSVQQQTSVSAIFRILDSLIDGKYQLDTSPSDLKNEINNFISSLPLDNTRD